MKTVAFFSPTTGNGKTEFAINFGYTLAKDYNMKVLIMEVDPYSPKLYNVYLQEDRFVPPEEWSNHYLFEGKNFDQFNRDFFLKPKEFEPLELYFFPIDPDFDPFRHAGDYTFGIDQIFITRPWKIVQQIDNWNYFDILVLILPSRFSLLSSGFFLVNDAIIVTSGLHSISSVKIEDFNESIFSGIRVGIIITNAHLPLTIEDLLEQQIAVEKECFLPVLMTVPRLKTPMIPKKLRILGDTGIRDLFKKLTDKLYHFISDEVPQQLKASVTSKPLNLMIVMSTGLPVFTYVFEERQSTSLQKQGETILLGGSMIGVQAILNKITGTDEPLRTIDSGQVKLMIETVPVDHDRSIYGILWTTADDDILRSNLKKFTRTFVKKYETALSKKMIRKGDYKTAYRLLGETFFADKPKTMHEELMKRIESFAEDNNLPLSEETFRLFVQDQVVSDVLDSRKLLLAEFISKHNERHRILVSNGIVPTEEEILEMERTYGATVCQCVFFVKQELAPLDAITLLQLKTDEMKEIAALIIEKETVSLKEVCDILGMEESKALAGIKGLVDGNYIRKVPERENVFTITN